MMLKKRFCSALIMAITAVCLPVCAMAGEKMTETEIPRRLSSGLEYLLGFTDPGSQTRFDPKRIGDIIDFTVADKPADTLFHAGQQFGAPSAYYEFDIRKSLGDLLQLLYNRQIPSFALMPSSVRYCYWSKIEGRPDPVLPDLWTLLPGLEAPVVFRGVQHVENTPDLFSGAYFAYDLDSALVLYRCSGRNVFISITRQRDVSQIGRKGLILGTDENWDYVYSGQKGLTRAGLGWVDAYMYDSYSISIYCETGTASSPRVHCAVLKGVRAGWADLNMVKTRHVYRGLQRYGAAVKKILESPALPAAGELARRFDSLNRLSSAQLRQRATTCLNHLVARYRNEKRLYRDCFARIFSHDAIGRMNRHELYALVALETMKQLLGRKTVL